MKKTNPFFESISLSGSNRYNEKFLTDFRGELETLGYVIEIILPVARLKKKNSKLPEYEKTDYPVRNLSVDQFLSQQRDYSSLALIAIKKDITIYFVFNNVSERFIYDEALLPSEVKLYDNDHTLAIASNDPVVTFTYIRYYKKRLTSPTLQQDIATIFLGLISALFILIEILGLTNQRKPLFVWAGVENGMLLDVLLSILALILLVAFVRLDKPGLRIEPKQNRIAPFLLALLKGRYTSNPLMTLFVAIIGTVIGGLILAYILRLLGFDNPIS